MKTWNYVPLENALSGRQQYVIDGARALGVDVRAVRHDVATSTCFEKAGILGWTPERVVKAVFLHDSAGRMSGFVFPEFGTDKPTYVSARDVLPRLIGISRSRAKEYRNHLCPPGMELGTCTPFVPEDAFRNSGLQEIFVHETFSDEIVDISIGGVGELAHRTSLHLPYRAIRGILSYRFGDKIKGVDLFEKV